jgi:hypothetical protein
MLSTVSTNFTRLEEAAAEDVMYFARRYQQ